MGLLAQLAAFLGFEVAEITDRLKRLAIANAFIGLFGLLTIVFLLVAGFLALAAQLGPINAALIFAGVFLVLGAAVYFGMMLGENSRKRRVTEKRRSTETSAFVTTAAITALPILLRSPVLRNIGLPLAAVVAAALYLGKSHDDNPGA
ncbi:phage holin family protein [uncultured Devosia sp.]|uniref:phage holin family protein n=1 Tax=uncultured Devosia sp. TaxID=211434 RepID=UPI0035CA663C